VPEEAEPL